MGYKMAFEGVPSGVTIRSERGTREDAHAVVNVKLHWVNFNLDPQHWALTDGGGETMSPEDAESFAAWYGENESERGEIWYQDAIEVGWDQLQEDARHIFGDGVDDAPEVHVCQEGRSGGWASVRYGERGYIGPDDFTPDDPDDAEAVAKCADMLRRWAQFEETADSICRALPSEMLYRARLEWEDARATEQAAAEAERARIEAIRLATFYYDVPPSFA